MISNLASSQPATSLNLISISSRSTLAVVSLTLKSPPIPLPGLPAPAGPLLSMNSKNPMINTVGNMLRRNELEMTENKYAQHLKLFFSDWWYFSYPLLNLWEYLTHHFQWSRRLAVCSLLQYPALAEQFPGSAQMCPHCRCWTTHIAAWRKDHGSLCVINMHSF